jgi:DHA1 family bicyclomycin/chloramphenicol resistance-like MFS transporter
VGIGVLTLLSLLTIPETLKQENRSTSSLMKSLMGYFKLAKSPKLVAYVGISSLPSAGIFAYVAATPSIYINFYGVPAHYYGLLFAICIVGMMITNLLNIRLLEKFDYNQVLLWGSVGQLVIAILVGIITYYSVGGLFALVFMLFLYISSTGFIGANAMTGALNDYGSDAGAVSAVLGAFQYGGGIAGSALVGIFADGTPVPLGMVVAGSGVVCFFFVGLLYYQLNIKKDL